MALSVEDKISTLTLLENYSGNNPYICLLKKEILLEKKTSKLNEFNVEYITKNADFPPISVGKIVYIADWFAKKKQEEWNIEFLPTKLLFTWFLGETKEFYHVFAQYRQSVEPMQLFIPKNAVLNDFLLSDYHDIKVDFDRYDRLSMQKDPNRRIKETQKEGVQFLLSRKKCILADSMGYGKTMQLSVASVEGNFDCVLVICPASLKSTWLKELNYYIPERDITIIGGFQDFNKEDYERYLGYAVGKSGKKVDELKAEAKERGKWNENRYVIINFDILKDFYQLPTGRSEKKKLEALQNSPLYHFINNKKALIIIDEAHKLSEQSADRYKIIKSLIANANPDSVYLATGTPITNDPNNYFNLLSLIDAPIANDYDYYCNRYCEVMKVPINKTQKEKRDKIQSSFLYNHGKSNWYELTQNEKKKLAETLDKAIITRKIIKGGKNLDELKMRTSHLYLRRVKEDLGILPNKFVYERVFELNEEQLAEYNRLWEEYEAMKLEEDPKKELSKELLEGAIYRRYLSNLMVEHTKELTDRCIAKNEKVVIACCYDEELYTLKEYYGDKCVIYNGKISPKQKDEAVDKFMNDDSVMVFIGNIISAGVGLTLTKSRVVIFNSFNYSSSDCHQFEDRVYRIGQMRDCHIYYQYFTKTQTEKVWNTIIRKDVLINQVIKKESEK